MPSIEVWDYAKVWLGIRVVIPDLFVQCGKCTGHVE